MLLSTCSINSMLPCSAATSTVVVNDLSAEPTSNGTSASGLMSDRNYRPNIPSTISGQFLKNGHFKTVTPAGSTMPKDAFSTHQTHPQQQVVLLQQQQGFHKNEMVKSKHFLSQLSLVKLKGCLPHLSAKSITASNLTS